MEKSFLELGVIGLEVAVGGILGLEITDKLILPNLLTNDNYTNLTKTGFQVLTYDNLGSLFGAILVPLVDLGCRKDKGRRDY